MEYIAWYFFSIVFICLFCLGLRTVTDKGQIFYSLRQPFERRIIGNEEVAHGDWLKLPAAERHSFTVGVVNGGKIYVRPQYYMPPAYMKPLILCVTCMPSFWGTLLYVGNTLFVLSHLIPAYKLSTILFLYLPVLLSSSFINSIMWRLNSE